VRFVDALNDLQVAHVPIKPQTESFLGVALAGTPAGCSEGFSADLSATCMMASAENEARMIRMP
jgi:hypothetical protein